MSTQTNANTEASAGPPPADRGPGASLQVLRVVAVLHSLAFLGQPVFAGGYLMGDVDALALHDANAFIITGLDVIHGHGEVGGSVFMLVAAVGV